MYIKKGHNHKGIKNPMFGKTQTEETRNKMKLKALSRKYKPHSKTAKRNMSLAKKKWWQEHEHMKDVFSAKYKGENGSNWQGGKAIKHNFQRKGLEVERWRKSVFVRDNFTCVLCGLKGGWNKELKRRIILNADHIKPFALFPELRLDMLNGRTLCLECHKQTPTFGVNFIRFNKKYHEVGA